MHPRLLEPFEKRQAKAFVKREGKNTFSLRKLALEAGNYLPEIKAEVELLEKFLEAYHKGGVGAGYIGGLLTKVEDESYGASQRKKKWWKKKCLEPISCPSCHKITLKLRHQHPKFCYTAFGPRWPKKLYFECEECKANWMYDVLQACFYELRSN